MDLGLGLALAMLDTVTRTRTLVLNTQSGQRGRGRSATAPPTATRPLLASRSLLPVARRGFGAAPKKPSRSGVASRFAWNSASLRFSKRQVVAKPLGRFRPAAWHSLGDFGHPGVEDRRWPEEAVGAPTSTEMLTARTVSACLPRYSFHSLIPAIGNPPYRDTSSVVPKQQEPGGARLCWLDDQRKPSIQRCGPNSVSKTVRDHQSHSLHPLRHRHGRRRNQPTIKPPADGFTGLVFLNGLPSEPGVAPVQILGPLEAKQISARALRRWGLRADHGSMTARPGGRTAVTRATGASGAAA